MATSNPPETHMIVISDDATLTAGVHRLYQSIDEGNVKGPNKTFIHFRDADASKIDEQDGNRKRAVYCVVCHRLHLMASDALPREACLCQRFVVFKDEDQVAGAEAVLTALKRWLSKPFLALWQEMTKHLDIMFTTVTYVTHSHMNMLRQNGLLREEVLRESTRIALNTPEVNPLVLPYKLRLPAVGEFIAGANFRICPQDRTTALRKVERWYTATQIGPTIGALGAERAFNVSAFWFKEQVSSVDSFCTRCRGTPFSFWGHKCTGMFVNLSFTLAMK